MAATLPARPVMAVSDRIEHRLAVGALSPSRVDAFRDFLADVDRDLMHHRIILDNAYTRWFSTGQATDDELRHFLRQFSVFSNQFLVAALQRVINASSLEQSRAAREILLNELGVIYRKPGTPLRRPDPLDEDERDREGDPDLVAIEGTVDGGICRFRAAHFEWLLNVGAELGLEFHDLGKRRLGKPTTLHFCDELIRLYGHEDPMVAEGASFAVENWAAAGFWQELEDGLLLIRKNRHPKLKLAFFSWHNRVEGQHAEHTMEELEEVYFSDHFDRTRFMKGAREILEGIAVFWDGLEEDRLRNLNRPG